MHELIINSISDFNYASKTVILRIDINSPLNPETKKIMNQNRINESIPTISYLIEEGAKIAILAHQGDTLDYHNLIPMEEHAELLSKKVGKDIRYIDDVAGPEAQRTIKLLDPGEAVLLGNLRYLTEEVSTFEDVVKLNPEQMLRTYLIRNLAGLADFYVNDSFSAAHRNSPSIVAFEEILPSAAGKLLFKELNALTALKDKPERPCIFLLGGLKVSDAFGMMKEVLENGTADKILTSGVTAIIMLMALDYPIGKAQEEFIYERALDVFIKPARKYMKEFKSRIINPLDFAYEQNGTRFECSVEQLPINDALLMDIGDNTIELFKHEIREARTIFVNGPPGVYENELFEKGTREIWNAIANASGDSVIGGGDSVAAAEKLVKEADRKFSHICTGGGAMVRFLSGKELPLIKALRKAYKKVEA